jgi:xylan 1,4-beta-xylosidase
MPNTITINARGHLSPFPHFWDVVFGSGRAILTLRESYRRDLRDVKRITGLEYVRFHAIFHDEVGVYGEDEQGQPHYNFTYVDQIYDGLLENHVRPFVELSFMPRRLAAKEIRHPFWYNPIIAPPKDWRHWEELVYEFTNHVVGRYGLDEVAQWYFEVWNEPNLDFWSGKPKETTYYELYERTARAIKSVNHVLRVGGPATAQAAWVDRFINHCVKKKVPIDFVSTHIYGNDATRHVVGARRNISPPDVIARAVRKVYDQVKCSARPDLPIHWTEYNASYMNKVNITDSPFMGPFLAQVIRQCDGLVTTMGYWTLSDVFEEQGVVKRPFYGGYGLIAVGGIPKASYNAFKLLHLLGAERIRIRSSSALATRRADGSLAIAVWNYAAPGEVGVSKRTELVIKGLDGPHRLVVHLLDRDHGSPLATWEKIGRPFYPTREEQEQLRAAAELRPPETLAASGGNVASATLDLLPQSLALVEVVRSVRDRRRPEIAALVTREG